MAKKKTEKRPLLFILGSFSSAAKKRLNNSSLERSGVRGGGAEEGAGASQINLSWMMR